MTSESLERTADTGLLPDRLNSEPAVFKGCSIPELTAIAIISSAFWLPMGLLVATLFGAVTMSFGIAGIGVVASTVVLASVFRRVKKNKPDGYYMLRVRFWLADRNIRRSSIIRRSGVWDLGRS